MSQKNIETILNQLSEKELLTCVEEFKNSQKTGILEDGEMRNLARRITNEMHIPFVYALDIAKNETVKIAAFKWMDQQIQSENDLDDYKEIRRDYCAM